MADQPTSPLPDANYEICYWVDATDTIVDVAQGFENFASENQAENLTIPQVIGRNLLSFVHGDVTRMYVRTLLQSARLLRKPMVRPYRCDSPDTRRYMEMRISVDTSGLVCWEHRTVRTEPLTRRLPFTVSPPKLLSKATVRCSMCNKLKMGENWTEPDQAHDLPICEADSTIPVIYGICPECMSYPKRTRP